MLHTAIHYQRVDMCVEVEYTFRRAAIESRANIKLCVNSKE